MTRRSWLGALLPFGIGAATIGASEAASEPSRGDAVRLGDDQWRSRLSPAQYRGLRAEGPEPAGSSALDREKRADLRAGGRVRRPAFVAVLLAAAATAAQAQAVLPSRAVATFAGGCFWCVEADFDKVPGVLSTTSGYTGGTLVNPSYEQVAAKATGHAEVVRIEFDPARVSYERLLEVFWRSIDPTTRDRQFCDAGSPYRTAVFVHDEAQAQAARASLAALARSKPFPAPIVTAVEPAGAFYRAEEYHQDYHLKNPLRYRYYRTSCGRDARLQELWGPAK